MNDLRKQLKQAIEKDDLEMFQVIMKKRENYITSKQWEQNELECELKKDKEILDLLNLKKKTLKKYMVKKGQQKQAYDKYKGF